MRKNLMSLTDNELAILFQSGEESAFTEIFRRYYQRIIMWLNSMTSDQNFTEDLAQETLIKVSISIKKGQYRGEGFISWIHVIARNNLFMHQRNSKINLSSMENIVGLISHDNPVAILEIKERSSALSKALEVLPGDLKNALTLRLRGFKYNEIKQITGVGGWGLTNAIAAVKKELVTK